MVRGSAGPVSVTETDARAAIAQNPFWYHTMEVAPGVETPGWFDLRPIVDRLPWPDVRGKRCLDVGTWDGFLAFELERRGAGEVVATDLADYEGWDWPVRVRASGPDELRRMAGPRKGIGFEIARELLGSSARLEPVDVYDLSPERVGEFDVVVCGSLLLHLRDPLRALDAIRSVCRGTLLSTNQVDPGRTLRQRRAPLLRLDGLSHLNQWWLPNAAGHRQMLLAGGFDVERESDMYAIPYGVAHPTRSRRPREVARRAMLRAVAGNDGVPHHAALARPAV